MPTLLLVLLSAAPAAPAPCWLEQHTDALVRAHRSKGAPDEVAIQGPWNQACADKAARWLAQPDADKRLAAALWLEAVHTVTTEHSLDIPIVSAFVGPLRTHSVSYRSVAHPPEVLQGWREMAAQEKEPVVVRAMVSYLFRDGEVASARELLRANLRLVPSDALLADVALEMWQARPWQGLTPEDVQALWKLAGQKRTANAAKLALAVHREPRWLAQIKTELAAHPNDLAAQALASASGLGKEVAPRVLEQARRELKASRGDCFIKVNVRPASLQGSPDELLALAEILSACKDGLPSESEFTAAMMLSPEPGPGLVGLARIRWKAGEKLYAFQDEYLRQLEGLQSDAAVDANLELARLAAQKGPKGDDPCLWRTLDSHLRLLGLVHTPKAGQAVVELTRLASTSGEGDGSGCLWREREQVNPTLDAVGGPDVARWKREVAPILNRR